VRVDRVLAPASKGIGGIVVIMGNSTLLVSSLEPDRVTVTVRTSVDVVNSRSDAAHWPLMVGGQSAVVCSIVVLTNLVGRSSEARLFCREWWRIWCGSK
jgi:hypothetical protein